MAGAWVVSENRLVEGVLAAVWEGVPKLNPPVPDVEKENPAAGVAVAVFAVPNVNPPVGAPAPPKLNPLMAPDSSGSSYSGSQSKSVGVCNLGEIFKAEEVTGSDGSFGKATWAARWSVAWRAWGWQLCHAAARLRPQRPHQAVCARSWMCSDRHVRPAQAGAPRPQGRRPGARRSWRGGLQSH